jgi:TolB-like protein/cytochrome c-type biogenesis protein CcmH/NrfG
MEIGHVLFIDIVGYSKLLIEEQKERLGQLTKIVLGTAQVRDSTDEQLVRLPTGDGMALVFRHSAEEPARCALEIAEALRKHPEIPVRMGIHSGPVSEMSDVNERTNVAGAGINLAQRVMDCGDAGHILLSRRVAEDLAEYRQWQPRLHDLGECEVKHGVRLHVFNLYTEEFGNPAPPVRFVGRKQQRDSRPSKSRSFWIILLVLLFLIFFGVPALIFTPAILHSRARAKTNNPPHQNAATAVPEKSIAVLPFVNLSAEKSDEYLSDGMTEELLNALTKVKQLRVPGRSSSFAFKGMNEEDIFRKVGQELRVQTVLEGSVRKAGDKLRVTAQLIKVADGFHLWSETYDGDMKDILAFQSAVAKRVVEALQLQMGIEEARALAKRPTESPEAQRLYLRGRYNFAQFTQEGWTNAIRDFEQALRLDPKFALAYCGLADIYGWAGGQTMPGKEAWAKQMELARKALALDPELAEAHLSMGTALQTSLDLKGSEKELDRAVELNPNLALAYDQYGWTFATQARFDEALANEKEALELDPLNPLLNTDLAWFYYLARRYDEATTQIRSTLELNPNGAFAHNVAGWCAVAKKNRAEARAEFQKAAILDDLPWYRASVGYTDAFLGDRAEAGQILRELQELSTKRYVSPSNVATVYLGLGETEKTFDWLDKAFEVRDPALWWIKSDQLYDSVREAPRFRALTTKIAQLERATQE